MLSAANKFAWASLGRRLRAAPQKAVVRPCDQRSHNFLRSTCGFGMHTSACSFYWSGSRNMVNLSIGAAIILSFGIQILRVRREQRQFAAQSRVGQPHRYATTVKAAQ
jgi:hypothetical protein